MAFKDKMNSVKDFFTRSGKKNLIIACAVILIGAAVLKERSPSCGCGQVYDGTFTGVLVQRDGVTAELLRDQGIPVYGESQLEKLIE